MEVRKHSRTLLLVPALFLAVSGFAQQSSTPVAPLDQSGHVFSVTTVSYTHLTLPTILRV